ncbi:hypothetical protein VTP01DRAFT_7842 [Rhizomucor pusillus]|uniref:uncharacterized protein n=1 Tax=Rhizomucor pusillus TaxID=4840 RepID=UPI003742F3F4
MAIGHHQQQRHTRLFGGSLSFAVERSGFTTAANLTVPTVLAKCEQEIRRRGLSVEGIFRHSGSSALMDKLQEQFEACKSNIDLSQIPIHAVAGLFKRYLRLLPEAVIPATYQSTMLNAYDDREDRASRVHRLIDLCQALPREYRDLLYYVLELAHDISQHCIVNKMTATNLAIIFAPTCVHLDGTTQLLPAMAAAAVPPQPGSLGIKARRILLSMVQRRKQLMYKPQELLQHDIVRRNTLWNQIFEDLILTPPSTYRSMDTGPLLLPCRLQLSLSNSYEPREEAATMLDREPGWLLGEQDFLKVISRKDFPSNIATKPVTTLSTTDKSNYLTQYSRAQR